MANARTAADYTPGDAVNVLKYGDWYPARVIKTGRVTVTVHFYTKGGKDKIVTVSGADVPGDLRPIPAWLAS